MFYLKRQIDTAQPEITNWPQQGSSRPISTNQSPHPLLHQQQTMGNQAIGRILQAHFTVSRPGDADEREADQVAKGMNLSPSLSGYSPAGYDHNAHGGRPLPGALQAYFATRFGDDLSQIRLHTGPSADKSARGLNALAYTTGQNIVFATGQYAPETAMGRTLLAHELAHTVQQRKMGHTSTFIQRQANGPITAKTIFPYQAGTRLTLNHLLKGFMLDLLAKKSPELAQAIGAMVERRATVTVATDDLFEATIEAEPATGDRPARSSLALRLKRTGETFSLEFFSIDEKGNRTVMQQIPELKARRHDGGTALSGSVAGQKIDLGVRPGGKSGQFTLGAISPLSLDVLEIRALVDAPRGSEKEQAEVKKAAAAAAGSRRIRNQRLQLGTGGLWVGGDPALGILGTSWQLNFKPTKAWWGAFVQIPVEVQFQYAPGTAVLAALNSGVEVPLPPVLPINVRFISGIGAGTTERESATGSPERQYLFGPTLGAGVGLEKSWFRMDLRYEHLFNLLESGPNTDAIFLRFGIAP